MAQHQQPGSWPRPPSSGFSPYSRPDGPPEPKRKRTEPKFYAVRAGHMPGIYHNWPDCQHQITGYKGATFKSFSTLTEAEAFLEHGLTARSRPAGSPQKFYAVRSGRVPGVYEDWELARQQIVGWKMPKHKSFLTRAEAEAFVNGSLLPDSDTAETKQEHESTGENAAMHNPSLDQAVGTAADSAPSKRRQKKVAPVELAEEDYEPGTGPLPFDAEDGFDHRVRLNPETGELQYKTQQERTTTKMQATGPSEEGPIRIYTDGSSLGNGKISSISGVGVYFGPMDSRNVSEALVGSRQTNQRAELTAIQRAVEIAPRDRDIVIVSDSDYAIKCVTEWFIRWRQNEWMTSQRKPVENRDLIEVIINKIDERRRCRSKTDFQWVKGHAKDPGNIAADTLAVNGAREAQAQARRQA